MNLLKRHADQTIRVIEWTNPRNTVGDLMDGSLPATCLVRLGGVWARHREDPRVPVIQSLTDALRTVACH